MSAINCEGCQYQAYIMCKNIKTDCTFCPMFDESLGRCKCTTVRPFAECPYFIPAEKEVNNA